MTKAESSIAVLGALGMLGSALCVSFSQKGSRVRAFSRKQFNVTIDSVSRLDLGGVDLVVNAIGAINRRAGGGGPLTDFYLINGLFPRVLADHCQSMGIPLIHVSTDCVFSGESGPYDETDTPSATDLYGRSKALGEPKNCMVIRTSFIGPEMANFYSLLCWFLNRTEDVGGFTNHLWNGMTTLQFADIIDQIMKKDLFDHGLYHVFGEDTTKYELLKTVGRVFGKTTRVKARPAPGAKDTRLRSVYKTLPGQLSIPSLSAQVEDLTRFCDDRGRWKEEHVRRVSGLCGESGEPAEIGAL